MSLETITPAEVKRLADEFENRSLEDVLRWCWERFGTKAAFGTSFQGAGLVAIDTAYQLGFRFPIFTLDTGLLFPETLELKAKLEQRLGVEIESLHPEQSVAEQAADYGPELWNKNPDLCCSLRKVIPLQKKLTQLDVWITGLRRDQAQTREQVQILELYKFDVLRDGVILKLNPMVNWSREQVRATMQERGIPSNPLQERGFRSIGCIPCTRPVGEGQDERAGRWTGFNKTECGIHTFLGDRI